MRRLPVALVVAALLVSPAAIAAGARTSLPDVEDEVMCPICGTLLELSSSPQADRERAFIRGLIAEGKSKEEIKGALVAQYGRAVLATPSSHGFDVTSWLVPVAGLLLAALAVALSLRRWRRTRGPDDPEGPLRDEEESRLDADLARYDL
jgi:cytochrome c-type biogenesis protein CcmH/NrfF